MGLLLYFDEMQNVNVNSLGDLVILPLYPTDQKCKIAAKYTASNGGSKSAQLAHVPDRKQASQADSEPPYEEVY